MGTCKEKVCFNIFNCVDIYHPFHEYMGHISHQDAAQYSKGKAMGEQCHLNDNFILKLWSDDSDYAPVADIRFLNKGLHRVEKLQVCAHKCHQQVQRCRPCLKVPSCSKNHMTTSGAGGCNKPTSEQSHMRISVRRAPGSEGVANHACERLHLCVTKTRTWST